MERFLHQVEEMEAMRDQVMQSLQRTQKEREETSSRLASDQSILSIIEKRLLVYRTKYSTLKQTNYEREQELQKLREEIRLLQFERVNLQQRIVLQNQNISQLKKWFESLKEAHSKHQAKCNQKIQQNDEIMRLDYLSGQMKENTNMIEDLGNSLMKKREYLTTQERRIEELLAESNTLFTQLQEAQMEAQEQQKGLSVLKESFDIQRSRCGQLRTEICSIQREIEELQIQIQHIQET